MPCVARSEDGTVDRALCESISLHPIKNHQICNQKGLNCESPYRICRVCAGQRFRVFGCYRKDWKDIHSVDLENIKAIFSVSGLCYEHHMQEQNKEPFSDKFPHKVIPKPVPATSTVVARKRRGRKPHLREIPEEELVRDICDEMGELPEVDFDPDEDLGVEPGVEVPTPAPAPAKNVLPVHSPVYQRTLRTVECSAIPTQPAPKPVPVSVSPLIPTPRLPVQRNHVLEELAKLRAFLKQPSLSERVIVQEEDDED